MGSTELTLLLKYGVPFAVKLLAGGKNEADTIVDVTTAISDMANSTEDVVVKLVNAEPEQAESIVDGLVGLLTGAGNALGTLINAFVKLLKP